MTLSRQEVAKKFHVSEATVKNWARGYYYVRGGDRIYYFPDHSHLPLSRNELGRPFHEAEDVQKWMDLIIAKLENKRTN